MLQPQLHQILSGVLQPESFDVLLGRGSIINRHKGNIMYRNAIDSHRRSYGKISKVQKSVIAKSIISFIRSLGGRFLEKDKSCDLWFEIGDQKAIEKVERSLQYRCRASRKERKINGNHQTFFATKQLYLQHIMDMQSMLPDTNKSVNKVNSSPRPNDGQKIEITQSQESEVYQRSKVNLFDSSNHTNGEHRNLVSNFSEDVAGADRVLISLSTTLPLIHTMNTEIENESVSDSQTEYVDVLGL